MISDRRDFIELQDRLSRLEKQNRRCKQLGVAALLVVVSLIVMAQAPSSKTVEANEFILRDGSGNVRARLSMNESRSGPEMVLLDEKGRSRIKLEGFNESLYGGSVTVFNSQGQLTAVAIRLARSHRSLSAA